MCWSLLYYIVCICRASDCKWCKSSMFWNPRLQPWPRHSDHWQDRDPLQPPGHQVKSITTHLTSSVFCCYMIGQVTFNCVSWKIMMHVRMSGLSSCQWSDMKWALSKSDLLPNFPCPLLPTWHSADWLRRAWWHRWGWGPWCLLPRTQIHRWANDANVSEMPLHIFHPESSRQWRLRPGRC